MMTEDEGIRLVRNVREKISAEFANDPDRLIEHYIAEQERYRERLIQPGAVQQTDTVKRSSSGY